MSKWMVKMKKADFDAIADKFGINRITARLLTNRGLSTDEEIRELVKKARLVIPEKVATFAEKMGVSWGKISIRKQTTVWGSCSMSGNLSFNCLLMLMPESVVDYVVVHELAHRIQMNHSRLFWAEVEKMMPDYKLRRDWLKKEGGKYLTRMREKRNG